MGPEIFCSLRSSGTHVLNGGLNLALNRTVFPDRSIDPWSALGMTTNSIGNIAYLIKGIRILSVVDPRRGLDPSMDKFFIFILR